MYVYDGSPTLNHCTFTSNSSSNSGGGLCYHANAAATLSDCIFKVNSAGLAGGGLCSSGSKLTLMRCVFESNWVTSDNSEGGGVHDGPGCDYVNCIFRKNDAWYGSGGGVYEGGTFTDCAFEENTAYGQGGAVLGGTSFTRCRFVRNTAWYGGGGGVCSGLMQATDCDFVENTAWYERGGGVTCGSGSLTGCTFYSNFTGLLGGGLFTATALTTRCTFTANSAILAGGALTCTGSPVLVNCAFNGNMAYDKGGALCSYGTYANPAITNCTFIGNTGQNGGSVIFNTYSQGRPTLVNCILWHNGMQAILDGQTAVSYSCVQGGFPGTGNINVDPLFVDADGEDDTTGTADDDLRLQPTSPCIDAGTNNAPWLNGIITDLAGNPRFVDSAAIPDTGNGIAPIIDMGAYEWSFPPDGDEDGVPDASDECPGTIPGAAVDADGCPAVILGDFNRDGDVDADDLDQFEACATAPGVGQTNALCAMAKLDGDDDVDQIDFAIFQRCLSGENVPADSGCED